MPNLLVIYYKVILWLRERELAYAENTGRNPLNVRQLEKGQRDDTLALQKIEWREMQT